VTETASDLTLYGTVLVASLVGSLHCAGMCGVFVAMAVGAGDRVSRARLQALYHGGRLVGYTTLGVIAGSIGRAVDIGASEIGLHHAAAIAAAVSVLLVAAVHAAAQLGVRVPRAPAPPLARRLFAGGARAAQRLSPSGRALTIGLLTALLPCGWLYAFALIAAGAASPISGGLVMAAFWVGTVPVLALIGAGAGTLRRRMGVRARVAATLLVGVLGAGVLLRGVNADLSGVREAMQVSGETSAADVARTAEAPCPLCETSDH